MKSIKKLMSFNNHKVKEKRAGSVSHESLDSKLPIEEESKELQDLKEMRNQYEGLCAVSSLVSSRAAEFSSAIHDLAQYFVSTFGTIEGGEMSMWLESLERSLLVQFRNLAVYQNWLGKVFKIVGRVQFEISKILDIYAAHVTQTITEPTEILLSELRHVQDSKTQHDEKRQLYEQLRTRISKGRPRNGKGDAFADQQLQVVKDEFDKLSLFVNTRLDSLEQGQARSLITQATRHHSAQMHLFSRGHSSLQSVEPYMRQVARERSIDRQLSSGINCVHELDDDSDTKSEDDVSYIEELDDSSDPQSLDQSNRWDSHRETPGRSPNNQDEEAEVPKNLSKEWSSLLSKLNRTSGEDPHFRGGDTSGSTASQPSNHEEGSVTDQNKTYRGRTPLSPQVVTIEHDTIQVTELLDESKSPPRLSHPSSPPVRSPPEKPMSTTRGYDGVGLRSGSSDLSSLSVSTSGRTSAEQRSYSDSDPAVSSMHSDSCGLSSKLTHGSVSASEAFPAKFLPPTQKLPGPIPRSPAVGKPPFLSFVSPTLSSTPAGFITSTPDSSLHIKRYSQSGPLTFSGTPWSGQPSTGNMGSSTNQSFNSSDVHKSGPLGRSPLSRTFGSPRISPSISPPRMSPPRISELHKLPPPPLNPIKTKAPRSPPIIAHSAPLSRHPESQGNSFVNATPLPPPPLGSVPRSLSLPSRQRQQRTKAPSVSHLPEVNEEASPTSSHVQSATNSTASTRANGSSPTPQVQSVHKRVSSGNVLGQEIGLPPSDLKFVHFNATKSASGSPALSSQHRRPPSPPARGGKDKAQQLDGRRADSGSYYATPLKSGGGLNPPRWRSLSINDKDTYIQSIARAVAIQREFSPEMVSLNPT